MTAPHARSGSRSRVHKHHMYPNREPPCPYTATALTPRGSRQPAARAARPHSAQELIPPGSCPSPPIARSHAGAWKTKVKTPLSPLLPLRLALPLKTPRGLSLSMGLSLGLDPANSLFLLIMLRATPAAQPVVALGNSSRGWEIKKKK